jgi:hypothetical protein
MSGKPAKAEQLAGRAAKAQNTTPIIAASSKSCIFE